ncbi:EAL domain-containing protein [Erwinia pyrifoliae]|uniref:cyclic-guanylate-specific phosphodiesterase n=1 Tax=Erwinia pyrifoliae TaxID=79967 RepID=A0ABY5X7X7_ERWPY|nr:cyclic diguanylate phosphodiesterase [Erwinia pyrifoliae]UWS33494.1 cyclic diguanylate phosphodiesterase [Erwinia pyrifoliae]
MQPFVKPKHERIWLVASGLLPLLLCLFFSFIAARQAVERQQEITAATLLSQAEYISDLAWDMTGHLRAFSNQPCADISSQLQKLGTLNPYFRSVGLTRYNTVYCSSAFGSAQGTVAGMIRHPLPPSSLSWWTLSLAGTYGVQDRPAVIFMRQTSSKAGSYAVVDGQYLIDLMRATGLKLGYHITMQFGGGYQIASAEPSSHQQESWKTRTFNSSSSNYPVSIRISAPCTETLQNGCQILLTFMPMAVILSVLFVALTNSWLRRRSSYRDEIRRGMALGEFSVHYQPVCNLESGQLAGVECLMRWQRSDGSWVRPDIFVSAAENEGMIVSLTRHLLQLIEKDCASWQVPVGFHIGVNVAADHLQHDDFVNDIRKFSQGIAHLQPTFTLELTERSLISEGEQVAHKLAELRSEGIRVAIDDFGTGHCSLSYLQTFPLDYLKIDKGFVKAIESADGETPVLDIIIQLAHKLALQVVAEGVETPLQLEYLRNHGVVFMQGYYYARPMSSAALMQWIEQQNA